MSTKSLSIKSMDEFINAVPERFLKTLKQKIEENNEPEALDLVCQYVVKFFSYIPYNQCYHHGDFVYALFKKAMTIDK